MNPFQADEYDGLTDTPEPTRIFERIEDDYRNFRQNAINAGQNELAHFWKPRHERILIADAYNRARIADALARIADTLEDMNAARKKSDEWQAADL